MTRPVEAQSFVFFFLDFYIEEPRVLREGGKMETGPLWELVHPTPKGESPLPCPAVHSVALEPGHLQNE